MILPVLITPEHDHPREHAVLEALFADGLERCHVRKPHASASELRAWIERVPVQLRDRLVLHQHHELVAEFGLLGRHWRDAGADLAGGGLRSAPPAGVLDWEGGAGSTPPGSRTPATSNQRVRWFDVAGLREAGRSDGASELAALDNPSRELARASGEFTSRSCHDLETLAPALGRFDSVFLSPVFSSVSKPGYGPSSHFVAEQMRAEGTPPTSDTAEAGAGVGSSIFDVQNSSFVSRSCNAEGGVPSPRSVRDFLRQRSPSERTTVVVALGGVTADTAPRALAIGFDGVALLGAVWQEPDPVAAYLRIRDIVADTPAEAPADTPDSVPTASPFTHIPNPSCNLIGYTMTSAPAGGQRVV